MSIHKDKKKTKFVNHPEYPGGPKQLTQFLYSNLQYPALAEAAGVEGTVLVEYDIDYQGKVVATRVIQGLGHGCDEEACRVVRLLRFDVAKNRDFRVLFHQKARIQFVKPKPVQEPAPVPAAMELHYQIVAGDAPVEPAPPASPTFSYTITL